LVLSLLLAACAAPLQDEREPIDAAAHLAGELVMMDDGYRLPVRRWGKERDASAVLLALHGLNDYSNAFAALGPHLAAGGVLTYAYDQRGFGTTAQRGRWAGTERMLADLRAVAASLRRRHPDLPLYLLGESMGGAVVMAAQASGLIADGAVLVAPAVWSRDTMHPIQRLALWAGAHTLPWLELTGRGLDVHPSDNLPMLRAFSADPLVIKGTRIEALWGVTDLMDLAAASAPALIGPTLILYGERDEIIPDNAFCAMLRDLPRDRQDLRLVLYRRGWHMLTRDLQGERVLADIAAWLADPNASLPSLEETGPDAPRIAEFCPAPPPRPGAGFEE
jgi:alpha-beta hydrolase superfamily lysophospholipase